MSGARLTVRLPDEEGREIVRTILTYESVVRKRRIGQTLLELVLEAVDIGSYPEEVQGRIREISEAASKKAVESFLSSIDSDWEDEH